MNLRLSLRNFIVLTGIVFSTCFFSCNPAPHSNDASQIRNKNLKKIQKSSDMIEDCDLILRTGRSFISSALRRFSLQDKTYSHCGIIRIINGKAWVYHAIGGEDHPDASLRRESISAFCNPKNNIGFGIFRYHLNTREKKRIDSLTDAFYRKKTPFDMHFSLDSDSALYCSEFIYKVITRATQKNYLPTSRLGNFTYVAIDNLYLNAHTHPVYRALFQ